MTIQHSLCVLSLAVCAALGSSALAQQNYPPGDIDPIPVYPSIGPLDITFEGEIMASVCTPVLSGPSVKGNTVKLDPAETAELAEAGDTAKPKEFTITVTCPTLLKGPRQFWAHFEGASVNPSGRFASEVGSANVSFQLLDGLGGDVIVAGGSGGTSPGANQGTGSSMFTGAPPPVSASKTYAVQYYAENGLTPADAGLVSANGTYTVYFY